MVGELRMHVVEAGDGPLVVLLHGFPDFWYSWRRQIPALVAAGYRVVAPDLRGYAGTEAPRAVDAYRLERLVADVAGLIDAMGEERAALVGHDWGGLVGWAMAETHPELVERLAVCNLPHPTSFARGLLTTAQLLRSWYAYTFMLPGLPELALGANDAALLRRVLRSGAQRPDSFTDGDLDRYVEALTVQGDLTGPVNYYRALGWRVVRRAGRLGPGLGADPVTQPVLVLWGDRDAALAPALADPPAELVPDARVIHFADAGHWVHLDAADEVNAELLSFLGA
jgi:epoxide hydrolase 4